MLEISRFFGIIVSPDYNVHSPAHLCVRYAEPRAIVSIELPAILDESGQCIRSPKLDE
jgi:hypothetical protein